MEYWRDELYHHGIKGQRWGIRRFQNPDGTLTPRGQRRYAIAEKRLGRRENYITKKFAIDRLSSHLGTSRNIMNAGEADAQVKKVRDLNNDVRKSDDGMLKLAQRTLHQRIGIGIGGAAATAGAAFVTATAVGSLAIAALPAAVVASGAAYLGYLTRR